MRNGLFIQKIGVLRINFIVNGSNSKISTMFLVLGRLHSSFPRDETFEIRFVYRTLANDCSLCLTRSLVKTIPYHTILQYHTIPYNTIQYHTIQYQHHTLTNLVSYLLPYHYAKSNYIRLG